MGKLGPVQLAYVRGNAWVLVPPPNQEKTTNDVVTYTLGGPSRGFGKALVGGGGGVKGKSQEHQPLWGFPYFETNPNTQHSTLTFSTFFFLCRT